VNHVIDRGCHYSKECLKFQLLDFDSFAKVDASFSQWIPEKLQNLIPSICQFHLG
jgi:hypothetical protein